MDGLIGTYLVKRGGGGSTGPQGPKGEKGDKGPKGDKGDPSDATENILVLQNNSGTYTVPNKSCFIYMDDTAASTSNVNLNMPTNPTYGIKIVIHKGRNTNNSIGINIGTDGFISMSASQKRQYEFVALPSPQDGKRYAISYKETFD